jgi:hypothetical protein
VKRILVVAIVVSFANIGTAQAPSATWKPPSYATLVIDDELQLRLQLAVLGKQLGQDGQDIRDMARPFTRDCELYYRLMNVSEQADVAESQEVAMSDMLEMYSLISTPKERSSVGKVLTKHIANSKRALESAIYLVNLSLGTPSMPTGAAVTGTRIRDDTRSEIELFDKVNRQ